MISERTLQRKLRREHTSFGAVLDEARRELAVRYVADERFGLVEVSYLLGFAQPSSFHRAFRRCIGTTPAAYRERTKPTGATKE